MVGRGKLKLGYGLSVAWSQNYLREPIKEKIVKELEGRAPSDCKKRNVRKIVHPIVSRQRSGSVERRARDAPEARRTSMEVYGKERKKRVIRRSLDGKVARSLAFVKGGDWPAARKAGSRRVEKRSLRTAQGTGMLAEKKGDEGEVLVNALSPPFPEESDDRRQLTKIWGTKRAERAGRRKSDLVRQRGHE